MSEKISYSQSGVNIDEGNKTVELIKEKVRSTYNSNVLGDLGSFSGLYSLKSFMGMKEPVLLSSTDGVGTKLKIAQLMDKHDTVGIDLVAMCVNDLICQGAMPLFFLDYIAVGKLDSQKARDIVFGIAEGCKQAECALVGGETAEMPGMYSEDEYDLAGFSVGICDKEKLITGENVKEGDAIIGIASSGVHSNGYSLVRKLFLDKLGWSLERPMEGYDCTLGDMLLRPTKIYVKLVRELMADCELKAIAHITGGGLIENVPRVLPKGMSASIKKDSWEAADIFSVIKELDMVEERELYRSFNMGIGLVMVVDKEIADKVIEKAMVCGEKAFKIGEIAKGDEGVVLW